MPILEIITIGTELLLGELIDTNSTYIARTLRDQGIDIYRITTIGDNPARITSAIKEALKRADIIITTGGLGPTVDDPTRQAVADATNRKLEFQPELWERIRERFQNYGKKPTENNRKQAYIPQGAIPIDNPVGTAPCFIVEIGDSCIASLPGVPREMELILHKSIIPYLRYKFGLKSQIIKATVLHAASIGESMVDEIIDDLEKSANPSVGLLAHPGQVDIRVTSKAESEHEAVNLSKPVVEELIVRLGENIYGQDEQTLECVVCQILNQNKLSLYLVEFGLAGMLIERIKSGQPDQIHTCILDNQPKNLSDFENQIAALHHTDLSDICFGVALVINDKAIVHFVYLDSHQSMTQTLMYGGPRDYASLWAQNTGLDFLRRQINHHIATEETGES